MNIADQYCEIKIQIEALEEALKPLKAALSDQAATLGERTESGFRIKGEFFAVTVTTQSRATLNAEMLMSKFGLSAAQLEQCKKEAIFDVIRHKAI